MNEHCTRSFVLKVSFQCNIHLFTLILLGLQAKADRAVIYAACIFMETVINSISETYLPGSKKLRGFEE